MCIVAMYTTTCTRLVRMNSLGLFGLASLFLVVGVRLVPLGFTRLITLVNLVSLPLILFLQILGIGNTLLLKHLTLRGRWLLGLRMHGKLRC